MIAVFETVGSQQSSLWLGERRFRERFVDCSRFEDRRRLDFTIRRGESAEILPGSLVLAPALPLLPLPLQRKIFPDNRTRRTGKKVAG